VNLAKSGKNGHFQTFEMQTFVTAMFFFDCLRGQDVVGKKVTV